MAETRTKICTFRLDERGFVHARLDPGATMDEADAREAIEATYRVAGEKRRPVLVDLRQLAGETRAARLYFVSDEAVARYSACALLVASPVSRVIGTFFLRLTEHKVPTRMFSNEAEAAKWLTDLAK